LSSPTTVTTGPLSGPSLVILVAACEPPQALPAAVGLATTKTPGLPAVGAADVAGGWVKLLLLLLVIASGAAAAAAGAAVIRGSMVGPGPADDTLRCPRRHAMSWASANAV
jgi:hypothetical protein